MAGDDTINIAEKAAGFVIGGDTGSESGVSVSVAIGTATLSATSSAADPAAWSVSVPAGAAYIAGTSVALEVSASKTGFTAAAPVSRTLAVDLAAPAASYAAPAALKVGEAIAPLDPSTTDTDIAGYALKAGSTLPPGLALDAGTGRIDGAPVAADADTHPTTVTVTDGAGNPTEVDIAFPAVAKGDQTLTGFAYSSGGITFGESAPTLTAPTGALSYASDTPDVCTVDAASGALTILTAGDCTVRASAAATADYAEGSAAYTVTVRAAGALALTVAAVAGDDTINIAEKAAGFVIGGDTGSESGVSVSVAIGTATLSATSSAADPAAWSVSVPAGAAYIAGTSVALEVSASKTGFTAAAPVSRTLAVDLVVPALAATGGAEVNGAVLTLTYDEALDGSSTPDRSAFAVAGGTVPSRAVSAVSVSGRTVELTLAPAVAHDETGLTVSYTVPGGANAAPLRDAVGNAAAALAGRTVTNRTPTPQVMANHPPVFTDGESAAHPAPENGTVAGTVTATDVDEGDEVTGYALSGGADRGRFETDAGTGALTFRTAPDYERPEDVASSDPVSAAKDNDYIVVVTATSGAGDRVMTAAQTVTVTVTNVDEKGTVALSPAQPQAGTELSAVLRDPDGSISGAVWTWESSADRTNWSVIAGEEADAYTPDAGDVGRHLRATVSYTDGHDSGKSARGVSENAVQAAAGTVQAPALETATVTDDVLTLEYDEALDEASVPATSAFAVAVTSWSGGSAQPRAVSTVVVSGRTVKLTLASPVLYGDAVTVTYTVPAANPVRDGDGNGAGALVAHEARNDTSRATVSIFGGFMGSNIVNDLVIAPVVSVLMVFDRPVTGFDTGDLEVTHGTVTWVRHCSLTDGTKWCADIDVTGENGDELTVSVPEDVVDQRNAPSSDFDDACCQRVAAEIRFTLIETVVSSEAVGPVNQAFDAYIEFARDVPDRFTLRGGGGAEAIPRSHFNQNDIRVTNGSFSGPFFPAITGGRERHRIRVTPRNRFEGVLTVRVPRARVWTEDGGVNGASNVFEIDVDTLAPNVTGIEITSDPGVDRTYAVGEAIEATVTYREDVTVASGSPSLGLLVGASARAAAYREGSGTGQLVFVYQVAEGDSDGDGVSVEAGALEGGEVEDAGGNAPPAHGAWGPFAGHAVDGVGPALSALQVVDARLTLTYDEALDESSRPAPEAFTVNVEDRARAVTGVAVSERVVTLTLTSAVSAHEGVTVTYAPGADPIQDLVGNDAAALVDELVRAAASTVDLTFSNGGISQESNPRGFCLRITEPAGEQISQAEYDELRGALAVTNGAAGSFTNCLVAGKVQVKIDPVSSGAVTIALPAGTVETDASTADAREYFTAAPLTVNVTLSGSTVTAATVSTTAPGQVTGVSVTEEVGQLAVSWDAVTDASGYKVQWKSGSDAYNDSDRQHVVTGGATTSYTIPDLTAGTEYTVRVIATKTDADDGPPSSEATGTPQAPAPGQVTGVSVTEEVGQLAVSWDAVTDASGYKVQWKSGSDAYNDSDRQHVVTDGATTSYTIPDLTAGTEYTVRVIATKTDADDGPPSSEATGTPQAPAPGQVTGVSVTEEVGQLAVSWDAVTGASGYKVQWKSGSEDFDTTRQHVVTGGATTSYTIPDLTAGTEYTVRVIATKTDADDGLPSDERTGTPRTPAPGQVTGVSVTEGVGQLAVSWGQVAGASGYKVQWKSGGQSYNDTPRQHVVTGGATTSYTIPDLTAGTEYTVRVTATKANADDGLPSDERTGTPRAAGAPASTVDLTFSNGGISKESNPQGFCLRITEPAGETISTAEYNRLRGALVVTNGAAGSRLDCVETGKVRIKIDPVSSGAVTIALPPGTVATDASTASAPEYFAAEPLAVSVTLSGDTVTAATVVSAPGAPRGVYTEAGNARLTLHWSPVHDGGADIEKFQYQQRTTGPFGTDWTDIPDSAKPDPDTPGSGANFQSYTVGSGVANETTYRYRLRAVNAAGAGPPSAEFIGRPVAAAGSNTVTATQEPPTVNGWDGVSTLNVSQKFLTYFEFGEEVRGFTPSDVSVTNGSAIRVRVERASRRDTTGDPNRIHASKYAVDIQPVAAGPVTVSLPAGKVFSAGGEGNRASNSLAYNYVASTVRPRVLNFEPSGCEATGNGFCVTLAFHHRARDIPVRGFEAADLTLTNGEVASLVSDEGSGYSVLEGAEAVQYYAVWAAVIQPESGYTGPFTVSMASGVVQDHSGNTNQATEYTTTVALRSGRATGSPITGFTLFDNAAGGADVQALADGAALAARSSQRLNIRAEAASGAQIGSVRLALSGAATASRTAGAAPWTLFGDGGGQAFPPGTYTITATPYPERDLGGTPGPTRRVTFTVAAAGDGGAPSATVTSTAQGPVSGEFAVTVRFSEPVTGFRMSELAVTNGRATRIASLIDATGYGTEHEVYVTPDPGAGGELTVTVPAGVATDAAGNPNTASSTFRIALLWDPLTGFTLFDNAAGGADVRSLTAGAELVVPASDRLNIRAGVRSGASVGSVRMTLTGAMSSSRTEGIAPYALFGDRGGRPFAPGAYTVTATPYPEKDLGGAPGWALSVTFRVVLPALSVADARAEEGTDETIDFTVTLDPSSPSAVTVDYATADGTAKAGEDYTAASGTLTFARGETSKTVAVAVLDDAKDEGAETFTLRLSNASGATLADAEATGTITNSDPMPKAWLARFGRTVAGQVVDAVSARLEGAPGSHVTVGGQRLGRSGEAVSPESALADRPAAARDDWERRPDGTRSLTGRELVLGSSFHLASGEGATGGPVFAAWGRFATGGFEADVDDVRMDGELTTGLLGVDAGGERWLAGAALSHSEGDGAYVLDDDAESNFDRGTVESTLTSVYPYARVALGERVLVWGLAGYGRGELTLTEESDESEAGPNRYTTDLSMTMGALGARGALLSAAEANGFALALRSDAFWVRMTSDAVEGLEGAEADASRLRLILEGSRAFEAGGGSTLTPSVELGLRHDGGDAETGTGVELGGRVSYADAASGLSMEARVRALVAHEDSDYREWGASGSVRLDPGAAGRGLSFSLAPAWGAPSSGVDRLWSARDARGLGPGGEFEPERRLEGELGYGLAAFGGRFTGTPNLGLGLSDTARDWRIGWRLTPAAQGDLGFEVNLDATRREAAGDDAVPENAIRLELRVRF